MCGGRKPPGHGGKCFLRFCDHWPLSGKELHYFLKFTCIFKGSKKSNPLFGGWVCRMLPLLCPVSCTGVERAEKKVVSRACHSQPPAAENGSRLFFFNHKLPLSPSILDSEVQKHQGKLVFTLLESLIITGLHH